MIYNEALDDIQEDDNMEDCVQDARARFACGVLAFAPRPNIPKADRERDIPDKGN